MGQRESAGLKKASGTVESGKLWKLNGIEGKWQATEDECEREKLKRGGAT